MLNAVIWDEDKAEFVAVEQGLAAKYDTEFNEVKEADLIASIANMEERLAEGLYVDLDMLEAKQYELLNHSSRISADNYEADVSRVNDRCANIFWRGQSPYVDAMTGTPAVIKASTNNAPVTPISTTRTQRRTDTVLTLNGLKLYPGWYREDRTYTYWFDNEYNVRYVIGVDRDVLYIQVWYNRKINGRWQGGFAKTEWFGSPYKDESEQAALLWLISHLDTVTQPEQPGCCNTPRVKTNPRGTRQWCVSCRTTWQVQAQV